VVVVPECAAAVVLRRPARQPQRPLRVQALEARMGDSMRELGNVLSRPACCAETCRLSNAPPPPVKRN
jgi:hypothetical protein